ncbi:hypothetical protein SAMD00019534_094200 [Acytostelium subglobosum LB1]|uniref:hypothetical protein n=1 Tax=Acytostelium subglobosum LB1 TaxID=1410327 RepID=UPI000644E871|nr:hypothetical protein SAMD00019534_094200 [Acytostelium subglobosum LB1]GAM26245.1 hypothetical protein SAMD00019534_094200 [Acytostelium subglobosum LB1]|eukprot:XP_012750799.1 hypothetical protein SAMD00019534_094200 [Acytostelium subglobosum LB1]
MCNLIDPYTISSSFNDIGGLDEIIQDIKDTIFLPLDKAVRTNNSTLFKLPRGILLHGPPGTGKTMLAKAIAKEAKYFFLNISEAVIESKFYGETPKVIAAIFSVAQKLQPIIIFFDEIDSMVGNRDLLTSDHNITKRSTLLQMWDGLTTSNARIVIIGATNRYDSIDDAFIRRLPKRIKVGLPNEAARERILRIMLRNHHDEDVDFKQLAQKTAGLSGSDLGEITRDASNVALKRRINDDANGNSTRSIDHILNSDHIDDKIKISMADINSILGKHLKNLTRQ